MSENVFLIFVEIFSCGKNWRNRTRRVSIAFSTNGRCERPPFRALCKENGADVVYTEFISSEGLIRDAAKSVQKLDIYEKERPVGIQIFGANMDSMLRSVEIVEATKPDIIDINFGCPVKKVVCKGAGAGI